MFQLICFISKFLSFKFLKKEQGRPQPVRMGIWVDLGYAPAAHVLIFFSVPCIVLRVEPSQKHTFFCPLKAFWWCNFFGGGFLVQKLHPKNWFHKSGVPPLNPIFLRSALCAQQMEMTVRKSTFQGFRQVYIIGWARQRKPFKKNQTNFWAEIVRRLNFTKKVYIPKIS